MQVVQPAMAIDLDANSTAKIPSRFLQAVQVPFRIESVICLLVLGLVAVVVPRSMADPDVWWHLLNAKTMFAAHAFVKHDALSFTAYGVPWIDHEWLAELPFYLGWRVAGATGVYVVTVVTIEAIFAGVLFLCWRASRSRYVACAATVCAVLLSTVSFGPRTLLFGWVCLVAELIVLEVVRERPMLAWCLPPLFALWINLHGSWVIGLAVLAIWSVGGCVPVEGTWLKLNAFTALQKRQLFLAWPCLLLALFVNPWTWRLVAYPFDLAFRQTLNIANVQEWHSLDLHSFRGRLVLAIVLVVVGKQFWKPRKWALTEVILFALGLWSCLMYSRFLFLFALLALPIAARSFRAKSQASSGRQLYVSNAFLIAAILSLLVTFFTQQTRRKGAEAFQFPAGAISALAELPTQERVFNEFAWGGYLEWQLPGRPVFIDSRVDIFEYNGTFKDYLDIIRIHNSLDLLNHYHIDAVLFEKDSPLVYLLLHTPGWEATYDDGETVLLERASVTNARRGLSSAPTLPIAMEAGFLRPPAGPDR